MLEISVSKESEWRLHGNSPPISADGKNLP